MSEWILDKPQDTIWCTSLVTFEPSTNPLDDMNMDVVAYLLCFLVIINDLILQVCFFISHACQSKPILDIQKVWIWWNIWLAWLFSSICILSAFCSNVVNNVKYCYLRSSSVDYSTIYFVYEEWCAGQNTLSILIYVTCDITWHM